VNPELFKKVHSTGVYFISVDVQVPPPQPQLAPPPLSTCAGQPQSSGVHAQNFCRGREHFRFFFPMAS